MAGDHDAKGGLARESAAAKQPGSRGGLVLKKNTRQPGLTKHSHIACDYEIVLVETTQNVAAAHVCNSCKPMLCNLQPTKVYQYTSIQLFTTTAKHVQMEWLKLFSFFFSKTFAGIMSESQFSIQKTLRSAVHGAAEQLRELSILSTKGRHREDTKARAEVHTDQPQVFSA